jgi:hypothetical protein
MTRIGCVGCALRDPETGKALVFLTNNFDLPALVIAQLYKLRWRVELFFKWTEAEPAHQTLLWHERQRGEDSSVDCAVRLCARSHHPQGTGFRAEPVPNATGFERQRI